MNLVRKEALIALVLIIIMLMSISLSVLVTRVQALTLYDSGGPTSAEQLVLEYINRARANPTAEGTRLGINIIDGLCDPNAVGVRPPLAMNKILLSVAYYHSWDMYTNNYFDHNDLNGHYPGWRMTNAGYDWNYWGENIAVGSGGYSATALEDILMVDSSTTCRGHRVNLFSSNFEEVGVGYYTGSSPNPSGLSNFLTQDFGSTSVGPFLVGVVYNDADGDNFYDIGEGISGVTITPSAGTYYAVSSTSGGYAIPLTGMSGSITVTASSSSFGTITKTVSLTGQNVKLDWLKIASPNVIFYTHPTTFIGASSSGSISACGSVFTNGQSSTGCGSSFSATANLPSPSSGWQFDHWEWSGGVSCASATTNPASCSTSTAGAGSLTAVYATQVTFGSALISWGSCANPPEANGATIFSPAGSGPACYVPTGYSISSWSCSGGLSCSGSSNVVLVSIDGPGTITLNFKTGSLTNPVSTSLTASATPSSTQRGTAFTISGSLTANGVGVGGETIVLVFGWNSNTVTVTAGSDGSYTYIATAPATAGSYKIQAFFLGDYSGSTQYLPSTATATITAT